MAARAPFQQLVLNVKEVVLDWASIDEGMERLA